MKYEIIGSTVPAVEVELGKGESMFTQSGAMTWMDSSVKADTKMEGGLLKGLGRKFAGESLFVVTYSAQKEGAKIAFASSVPGKIMNVDFQGNGNLICQKDAFLCAEKTVQLSTVFTKKISAGVFGGEGFILQKLSGTGTAFLEIDGDAITKELAPGETILVDTGNVVAFEESVSYEIERVKGVKNIFFGGEGLFLTKLTGPGKIILQTMNFNDFAGRIAGYFPDSKE
ncbi:TIGR00266 family protein [Anaerostipes sp.]|uniref:TIGR00266 family protein n=1 Tax=Anaerostipes sp. TaxID=1872530 RepID=UPI00258D2A6D|nr:TIGR00266 family protein [Anaerostipes sp.]MCI5623636.1 TIGR00266 family protein [Anaerostipes sp.]